MPGQTIRIDETEFPLSSGNPFEFASVHSGTDLSGVQMDITVYSDVDARHIEDLIKKDKVTVEDPFANRQYEATLTRKSFGYQEGNPEKWYRFEVKELDEAPEFTLLEIEGQPFHVLRNIQDLHDEVIGMHILVRLSSDEFVQFRGLLELGQVAIQRIGIDQSPITRRFGGAQYWSSHREGSQEVYKHIVRFYPADSPGSGVNIATGHEQRGQSEMILALCARYEALLEASIENGQISRASGEALMHENWRGLVDDERRILLRARLSKVHDAEAELY